MNNEFKNIFDKERFSQDIKNVILNAFSKSQKGFDEDDFREVGKIIAYRLKNEETDEIKEECLKRVKALTDKVTMYQKKTYLK